MKKISFFISPLVSISDEKLILEMKKGKNEAFEELYERRHKKIYGYLWNMLNYNRDDTVSLTSDVFIKFYEYAQKQNLDNVKGFIYRLAHNLAVDWIRSKKTYTDISLDQNYLQESITYIDKHKHNLDSSFKQKIFEKLITYLDSQQKEVLYLIYKEQKSYQEVADILGTNKNSIGTLLFTAKKKLNELALLHGVNDELLS